MTTARAEVAIPRPVRRLFTYAVPPALLPQCRVGVRVIVPFGQRKLTGYLVDVAETPAAADPTLSLKAIEEVLDASPVLDRTLLDLTRWAADYYVVSWGEMIRTALPGMRAVLRRELSITAEGMSALRDGEGRSRELSRLLDKALSREILGLVAEFSRGGESVMRLSDLKRKIGPRFRQSNLTDLIHAGLIRESEIAASRGPRPRTVEEAFQVPAGEVGGEGAAREPGPRQKEILRLLAAAGGGVAVPALLREAGASRPALMALERRGLVRIERREARRRPVALEDDSVRLPSVQPTGAQISAIESLERLVAEGGFATSLLHGVTGSGKTEVYLRAIERTLAAGRNALYLVPEIGLTPLLAKRLRHRFGEVLALLHSSLSDGERYDEWRRIREGRARVVLGTRSAVFAPLENTGLIVVDEEHDTSYKQDEYPRYNGRDLAIVRGRLEGAVVVLGSATPSMESYHNARIGKYRLLSLPTRVGAAGMPAVERVDMRREFSETGSESILSRRLLAAIRACHDRREQALILLNRRGFSTFVLCRACGKRIECRRCSIAMTLHLRQRSLRCHYCDDQRGVPSACPSCGSGHLHFGGTGTERLEDRLRAHFPKARIERMDRDTVRGHGSVERLLTRVERGEVDILLGTQMIAKGHDFPNVTLVGVLAADASLGLPDFRAGERTFQLLAQVAGRSGRRERGGEVIVQAYYADHHAVKFACDHDFPGFAAKELGYRRVMNYPPYSALALILVKDRIFDRARDGASQIAAILRAGKNAGLQVLGPAPAPLERLRGRYRVQVVVRAGGRRAIQAAIARTLAELDRRKVRIQDLVIDVDPISTL